MVEFGYALSSEEHPPMDLVQNARRAEEAGFSFAMVSDHYHPWISKGHSPFVWATLGGIAHATERLKVGTGVTAPIIRIHPAIIAQAAATVAAMMPGRFMLGLGAGENLNEHVLGDKWPPPPVRQDMLLEAIDIIRQLWTGEEVTHHGEHYVVEDARLFTLPDQLPPILVAAGGPAAARLAAGNDGLVAVKPVKDLIEAFESAGGRDKPRFGQVTVCYDENENRARKTAFESWPISGLEGGSVKWEIYKPSHFDELAMNVTEDDVAGSIICGPDRNKHVEAIKKFIDAGFDHIYIHQVGKEQERFFSFYQREVLPQVRELRSAAA